MYDQKVSNLSSSFFSVQSEFRLSFFPCFDFEFISLSPLCKVPRMPLVSGRNHLTKNNGVYCLENDRPIVLLRLSGGAPWLPFPTRGKYLCRVSIQSFKSYSKCFFCQFITCLAFPRSNRQKTVQSQE